MKFAACILILVISFSTVLPALPPSTAKVETGCCKKKTGCNKQDSKKESRDKNDCQGSRCNPFMGCSNYNLFLSVKAFQPGHILLSERKQKIEVTNDNRLSSSLSDCWHPPNS